MSKISVRGIKTSVNLLINTMAVLGLVFLPSYSLGDNNSSSNNNNNNNANNDPCSTIVSTATTDEIAAAGGRMNLLATCEAKIHGANSSGADCATLAKNFDDDKKAILDNCQNSGFSKNCAKLVLACQKNMSQPDSTDSSSSDSTNSGTTSSVSTKDCPQLSGKSYKELQKELDSAEKDSEDMQKSIQDAQDQMMQTKQQGQQKIDDANSQLKQAVLDTASQNQQRLTAFAQTQAQANTQIQQLQSSILKAQQDTSNQSQIEANALNAYSTGNAQSVCTAKMNQAKTDGTCVASSSTNYIATGNARKDCLINVYNTCVTDMAQKRQAAVTAFNQAQQADNLNINQLQAQVTDQQTVLKNQQIQEQTDNQNAQVALSNKQQDIAKMQTQITDQINQSVQKFQSLSVSLQQRQQDLNNRITNIKNQMAAGVGSDSSTVAGSDAALKIREALSDAADQVTQGLKNQCAFAQSYLGKPGFPTSLDPTAAQKEDKSAAIQAAQQAKHNSYLSQGLDNSSGLSQGAQTIQSCVMGTCSSGSGNSQ